MKHIIYKFIGPMLLIVLWQSIPLWSDVSAVLLPTPWATFSALYEIIITGSIFSDIYMTLSRVSLALGMSVVIGVPLGLLVGNSKILYESTGFLIDFFRSLPATAVFPVFLIIFGIDDASKIAVAIFAGTPVIIFNTSFGILNASKMRMITARVMHIPVYKQFYAILFWESLPQTLIGIRMVLNLCLILIIITEMFIGTDMGLGRRIIEYQITYQTDMMYAVIILTGLIGYFVNILFNQLQKRVVHWKI